MLADTKEILMALDMEQDAMARVIDELFEPEDREEQQRSLYKRINGERAMVRRMEALNIRCAFHNKISRRN